MDHPFHVAECERCNDLGYIIQEGENGAMMLICCEFCNNAHDMAQYSRELALKVAAARTLRHVILGFTSTN